MQDVSAVEQSGSEQPKQLLVAQDLARLSDQEKIRVSGHFYWALVAMLIVSLLSSGCVVSLLSSWTSIWTARASWRKLPPHCIPWSALLESPPYQSPLRFEIVIYRVFMPCTAQHGVPRPLGSGRPSLCCRYFWSAIVGETTTSAYTTIASHIQSFLVLYFHGFQQPWRFFNNENFPIYSCSW